MKLFLSIALASGASAPTISELDVQGPTPAPAVEARELTAVVDRLARQAVEREGVPGLSIAVARDGAVLVAKGFGYADAARGVPATENTMFAVGSLTRQFTAVGILQLVEAGKLELESELKSLLPLFPVGAHKVTIRHLLSNTSGIPGWRKILAKHPEVMTKEMNEEEFFQLFADVPFDFEPGADFALDSANYVLLSMILSNVSGERHAAYVRKHLIEPLGLAHTDFCADGHRPIGFATDCKAIADDAELEIPMAAAPAHATQSLCSTVGDLVAWQHALVQHALLGEQTSVLMTSPTRLPDGNSTNYGYALATSRLGDSKCYSHTGGIGGFRVRVAYYPVPRITIAICANCASAPIERIEKGIARFMLGLPAPDVVDEALSAEEAAACVGMYQIATTQIRILSRDGKLAFERPGEQPITLLHQGRLDFVMADDREARVTFQARQDGKCDSFVLVRVGFHSTARRMD